MPVCLGPPEGGMHNQGNKLVPAALSNRPAAEGIEKWMLPVITPPKQYRLPFFTSFKEVLNFNTVSF